MEPVVIVVNESTSKSIISDTYSLVILLGGLTFNHYLLGSSVIVTATICFLWICWLMTKGISKRMTVEEAKEYFCGGEKE